jgi:protein gp37
MSKNSLIEWTEATWNPVTGCSKVSLGCKFCYAERFAKRLQQMGNKRYKNGFKITLHHDLIEQPKRWRKPSIVFVNSMSDLFHEKIPIQFIQQVFKTMNECYWHQFQILTKRSERLVKISSSLNWTKNIWIGVSIENQNYVSRIHDLKKVPAKIRFVSLEPLLGPIREINLNNIQWVIAGGESGPNARSMKPEWVEEILEKCEKNNIPFFFKQWGGIQKWKNGRKFNGKIYDNMPVSNKPIDLFQL